MQAADNSKTNKEEIQLYLINLTGQTIKAGGPGIGFSLAVATMGNP